jgi:hypothetical protein
MKILFVASCSPIVNDVQANQDFFLQGLELPLDSRQGDYVYSEKVPGTKHFGLWPLTEAAPVLAWPRSARALEDIARIFKGVDVGPLEDVLRVC